MIAQTKNSKHVKCQIEFDDNTSGVYRPGDIVSGTITITLEKKKKFRGICLRINGFATSFWDAKVKTDAPQGNKVRKTAFKGREDYFSTINYFVGSDVGNPLEVMAGTYTYPFTCQIPTNAPASMESSYGHIRYQVTLSFERPWKYDIVYQQDIVVRGNSDLNQNAEALSKPTKAEAMTSFYFGLTEPLIVTATTPRSGYVPGDIIEVTIHVNNQSSVDVKFIAVKLQRVDTFISQVPRVERRQEFSVMEERITGRVSKRQDAKIEENILIGPGIPTDDVHCRVIQIKYELDIVVHPVRSRKKLSLKIPIVLGTTAMTNHDVLKNRVVAKQQEALMRVAPSAPVASEINDENVEPPSYLDLQAALASISRSYSITSDETVAEASGSNRARSYAPREF
ncbi:arrestin domain-containing protein 17-like [Armigeres subalbatus]|uniref:arrestin domain-containing protein 17-like n=1 Tax=Armigeres subalbatus TaxID=124917 RepID=UPI002ED22E82